MKQLREESVMAEAFDARARRRALDMLEEVRLRGEVVRDEGDFVARAMDQIYMDAREARRSRLGRGRHP